MKPLQVFITSNLQQLIDPDLTSSILAMLIILFDQQPFDMYVIDPDGEGKLQIRLAGYSFTDQSLDEDTIVGQTDLPGDRIIWFKVDDYGEGYVGTLLLPEDY